ncbi:hypothetical protein OG883_44605 [Streptomyces sp. NBC_01142]|uniref:hypothetical protein n=1 Tax=Streptomyces sp. NBC_01142 TaxID=2975865 RepID=UPI0022527C8A|nr:hypothetical protein [Streptomyces sp. NBC_01142]MCX4826727.1 hypothetical protein [Streptomyces sp. NBC_01142]
MPFRKTILRTAAPIAVLALGLTACDGGDSSDSGKSSEKPAAGKSEASVSPRDPAVGELAPGKAATGKVKEGSQNVTYNVVAEKVDVGTEAEAQKLVSDKEAAKGLVLAVAHVKFTHKDGPALTDRSEANEGTTIWADGKRGALLIGAADTGPGCEDPYDIKGWKAGESHTLCESYLVPANAKSIEVHWSANDEGDPNIWKFANKS